MTIIERNKIYNEDCLDTMVKMGDEFIDLVITSPPYDNIRNYNGYEFLFKHIANELYRVIKKGGIVVWVVGDATINGSETGTSFEQALYFRDIGFNIHDTMIYKKNNPTPNAKVRYQQCFEYMFVFSKGRPKTMNIQKRDRRNLCNDKRTERHKSFIRDKDGNFTNRHYVVKERVDDDNIWDFYVGGGNTTQDKVAFEHPAIFPEKLVERHLLSWSNIDDIVYDPFMGSGTTAKMCVIHNRYYIGSEISEKYCEIARKRIEEPILL